MNRLTLALVAIAATIAGAAASMFTVLLIGTTQPEPVQAAPEQPAPSAPIRIAVVNLEEVSRHSRQFQEREIDWNYAREDLQKIARSEHEAYERAVRNLSEAERKGEDEFEILMHRTEVLSYEESLKALRAEQADYLQRLLDEFQQEVLVAVLDNVRRLARKEGYQLVLQSHTLHQADTSFAGSDFAETLLATPVVDAPGMSSGSNTHVTDITQIMIGHMRKGGVPEKDD